MHRRKLVLEAITITFVIFAAGCIEDKETRKPDDKISIQDRFAINYCTALCRQKLNENASISNGPCLSNEITPDWVCDVAHHPRLDVDNIKENQCSSFTDGRAHHFVEINENCSLIRAI